MRRGVQLYIAGREVDLGDDSWILYNWTREDLSNPTAVVNSSSHQISIPGTCRNNAIFGEVFRLDRKTMFGVRYDGTYFDPTRKTPFSLYANDGTVLESGYCRLDSVNTRSRRHAYTVSLYGGLGSFLYALSAKEDGSARTLLDLVWTGDDGEDVPSFNVARDGAAAVADAWSYLTRGEAELGYYHFWNIINFAPCYNGLPEDFDAKHALSSYAAYDNVEYGYVDASDLSTYYEYKAGLDCALLTFQNAHTEWEVGDLRWYLQRPVVSVKAFFTAVCDPRNNGGHTVELDPTFFRSGNPAWADAWWTLPLIKTEDRTGGFSVGNLLASTKSPMKYLVDYCKIYGLLFLYDAATKHVRIVTRATFYGETPDVLDLSGRVDLSQDTDQDPVLADSRWYQLGDGGKGEFVEQYKRDYGKGYAVQRIDTGYEFDAGTKVLTDGQTFQDAAEVQESNRLYASAYFNNDANNRLLYPAFFEQVTEQLWHGDSSITFTLRTDLVGSTFVIPQIAHDVPDAPGADWLPKLQVHGAENKAIDGADILLYFTGMRDAPLVTESQRKRYFLTNDSAAMQELAGAPCWDLTRTGIPLLGLPSFRRVILSDQYITESLDWGVPAVRPVLDAVYPTGEDNSIYGRWWKRYLSDRYAADTRVLKCMADLRGLPVGQALLRRFCWLDGALWTINAIRNHSFTSWDLTEVELVKVQARSAYETGPGSVSTHYLTLSPAAASYTISGNGDTLNLTVRSSSAWTLAMSGSPSWISWSAASGDEGTGVITAAVQANTGTARRSVSVTITNEDGNTVTFSVVQAPKTSASISVSPSSITIPASGTGTGSASRGRSFSVTATGDWSLDMSTVPAWLTVSTSLNAVSMRCGENTATSERTAALKVYLDGDPTKYAIANVTQSAGSGTSGNISVVDSQGNEGRTSPAAGETFTLAITASGAWTLTNNTGFATLSASSGTGNGTVTVTVPAYTGSSDRSGTIVATLDGTSVTDTFYLQQAAPIVPDTYIEVVAVGNHANSYANVPALSGGDGVQIYSNAAWTLSTPDSWLHPAYVSTDPWSGTGDAQAWYNIDANTGAARTGRIIATLQSDPTKTVTFYVYQAAGSTPTTPTLNAYFSRTSLDSSAQTVDLVIDTQSGVAWTIDNVSSGLTPQTYSGTGPDTISVSVGAASAQRTLSLRVNTSYTSPVTASLTQSAPVVSSYLRVSPFGTVNVAADVTSRTFAVESNTSWRASTSASGVTVSPSTGSNNGSVTVTFGANSSTSQSRTIPVTFVTTSGTTITVNASIVQAPAETPPSEDEISVTPTTLDIAGAGETKTVSVTATGDWTASKSASWIVLGATGGSAGTAMSLTIAAARNTGAARTGTVTLMCGGATPVTVTVSQGSDTVLDVTPDAVELPAAGGSANVTVYASGQWGISAGSTIPGWLSFSASSNAGSEGGETLTFTASEENTGAASRSATIRVQLAGDPTVYEDVTVTQLGQTTLYLSPARVYVNAWQDSGTITVTCNTSWHVSHISSGVIIQSAAQSGSGNGYIPWYVEGNPTSGSRTLLVTVETDDGERSATVEILQEQGLFYFDPSDPLILGSNGETVSVDLVSSAAWTLDTDTVPAWLTVSPAGGSQTGTIVTFTAAANTSTSDRTATVAVENAYGARTTLQVTQRGLSNYQLTISPTELHLATPDATSGTLAITSNTSWYVEVETRTTQALTVSQMSGSGSRTITWNLPANSWETYFKHVIKVRTADSSIVRTCEIWQPPRSGVIISFQPDVDHLTFYHNAPESTKTYQLRVLALEDWIAYADGYAPWLSFNVDRGTANTPAIVTFTPTTSGTVVQSVDWVVETTGGYTRTITITTLPSS